MSKKKRRDLLSYHQEWVDHSYNPGYWINKVSWVTIAEWKLMRRYNKLFGIIGIVLSGIPLFGPVLKSFNDGEDLSAILLEFLDPSGWYVTLILGFIFFLSIVLLIRKPEKEAPQKQPVRKIDKKKKLPKRRKDYK